MALTGPTSLSPETRRVHIIGGPGSGKTTLARQLAAALKTTAYDLDEVGYEGGAGPKRSLAQRLADIRHIAARPGWVTEGVFLWWIDDLVEAAEAIIWLDLAWSFVVWRIIVRHFKLSLAGKNRHPGLLKLLSFLGWTRGYYTTRIYIPPCTSDDDGATSRLATARYLNAHQAKVILCRTPADVAKVVCKVSRRQR